MKIIAKNKKKADCGVVAAFNAASWCKKYQPYEKIEKVARGCGYNPFKGIWDFQFCSLLQKLQVPYRKINNINLDDLQSKLYLGKCFLISYRPTEWAVGHLVTVYMDKSGHIKVINPDVERMTWNEFAADTFAGGMLEINAYELPGRNLAL